MNFSKNFQKICFTRLKGYDDLTDETYEPAYAAIKTAFDNLEPQPLHEHTWYDVHGRVKKRKDFKGQYSIYRYFIDDEGDPDHYRDGQGNLLGRPGQLRVEEYHAGLPDSSPDGSITFTYDALGRKVREVKDGAAWEYAYDEEGRVVTLTSPQGTIGYDYSPATGRRMSVYTPAATPQTDIDYSYDELGRLAAVTVDLRNGQDVSETTTYDYNVNGSLEKVTYVNGNIAEYAYDDLNRLEKLTNWRSASTELLSRFEYSHDADGQRSSVTETLYGWKWDPVQAENYKACRTNVISYRYDVLNRLAVEQWQGRDPNAFAYDLVGNMVKRSAGNEVDNALDDVTVDYTYNHLDQLEFEDYSVGQDFTYQYDDNGSLERKYHGTTSDPYDEYEYNLQGRLAAFTPVSGDAVTYSYDPAGIRVSKQVGTAAATTYLIDPMNPTGYAQVFVADDGTTKTMYVLGSDVIAQATGAGDPTYLLNDGHGSVRNHANSAGELHWHDIPGIAYDGADDPADDDYTLFAYDAWGKTLQTPPGDGLQYTGEMYDAQLEMLYLRARYCDPSTGRFNRTDPYAGSPQDPQSLHKYLYCHANPFNGIDPEGSSFTAIGQAVVTGVRNTLEKANQAYATHVAPHLYWNAYRAFKLYAWGIRQLPKALLGLAIFDTSLSVLDNMSCKLLTNTQPIPISHVDRGVVVETVAGANLRGNFPRIDDWQAASGIATSIKTHALESSDELVAQIQRDAQLLGNIERTQLSGIAANGARVTIQAGEIQTKCVLVGIPQTQTQWLTLQSFRTAIQQLQTSTRCVIRVVPVKGWKK